MDLVIPFRHSINADKELIFALRSYEKYIPSLDKVYILGDFPFVSLKNITCIELKDKVRISKWTEYNIFACLRFACVHKEISLDFIMGADDFFLLRKFDLLYYHKGQNWDGRGDYLETETNTRELFEGKDISNFNVHCPRVFNKELFETSVCFLPWKSRPFGWNINTVYAVINNIKGSYDTDLKFNAKYHKDYILEKIRGRKFFSANDNAFNYAMWEVLDGLFPNKSRFEK